MPATEPITSSAQTPPEPRLCLRPTGTTHTLLDGGWWPRSDDPLAELPGLVLAIDGRHHPVARIMLGVSDWGPSRPRKLHIDGAGATRMIRLGWFTSMPAGLLTAICADENRVDLLTVPPHTEAGSAKAAMEQAARTDNVLHTPELLSSITATSAQTADAERPENRWESEGGR